MGWRIAGLAAPIGLVAVFLTPIVPLKAQQPPDPLEILRSITGFQPKDLERLRAGEAVVALLPSEHASDLFVAGAVHIRGDPRDYVQWASNIENLRQSSQYRALGYIGEPAKPEDFNGMALSDSELKELLRCKPGSCNYQLPASTITAFRESLAGSRSPSKTAALQKLRELAALRVNQYRQSGNSALGTYVDKKVSVDVREQFADLTTRVSGLSKFMPSLNRHLLEYPVYQIPEAQNLFYWEDVEFGLKPTFRINHLTSYGDGEIHVVAIKQLYASHYFQVALDLSVCVPAKEGGFYLINWRGSRQDGLSGFTGSILRKVVAGKVRNGQSSALLAAKRRLEAR